MSHIDNCQFCNLTDHEPKDCPATLLDYTGEQVLCLELVERLKYRQTNFVEFQNAGGLVNLELNCFICAMGHATHTKRIILGTCKTCGVPWVFRIRKGILEDMGGRVFRPNLANARVAMIGQNITFYNFNKRIPKPPKIKRGPGRPKGPGRPRKEPPPLDLVAGKRKRLREPTKFTKNGIKKSSKWNTGRTRSPKAGIPRWQYLEFMEERKLAERPKGRKS